MTLLLNLGFRNTVALELRLVDDDPECKVLVWQIKHGDDVVFFETPHGAELWDVVSIGAAAFKEFIASEGLENA
jgi:hypothetical protein